MKTSDEIMNEWLEANKHDNMTLNHNLNSDSIVLDIGSYNGKWSIMLHDKYKCNIYSYEPVIEFHNQHKKAVGNRSIWPRNYALDVKDGTKSIFLQKDGSSFLIKNSDKTVTVNTKSISNEFKTFDKIDLAKMNVEGVEFDLLNALYESGDIVKPHRFLIQFHKIEGYEKMLEKSESQLSETHNKLWGYGTIWQLWEKK